MNTPQDQSGPAGKNEATDPQKPGAADASNPPDADMQPEDSGTEASANRGSPAAPVMKQFSKTEAESNGRP